MVFEWDEEKVRRNIAKHGIDFSEPLREDQMKALEAMNERPAEPDEECPAYSEAELLQMMQLAAERRAERQKQTVTLRLSPAALRKARSLGKGYTSVLSRILESALNNPETIQHFL